MIFHIQWYFNILIFFIRSENIKIFEKKATNFQRLWIRAYAIGPKGLARILQPLVTSTYTFIFSRRFSFTAQDSLNLLVLSQIIFFPSNSKLISD